MPGARHAVRSSVAEQPLLSWAARPASEPASAGAMFWRPDRRSASRSPPRSNVGTPLESTTDSVRESASVSAWSDDSLLRLTGRRAGHDRPPGAIPRRSTGAIAVFPLAKRQGHQFVQAGAGAILMSTARSPSSPPYDKAKNANEVQPPVAAPRGQAWILQEFTRSVYPTPRSLPRAGERRRRRTRTACRFTPDRGCGKRVHDIPHRRTCTHEPAGACRRADRRTP